MDQHIRLLLTQLMPEDVTKLRNLFVLLWDIDVENPRKFAIRFRDAMKSRGMVWEGMAVCNLCVKWVMVILKYESYLVPIRLSLTDLYFWAFFTPNGWHKFADCTLDFEESVKCTKLRFGATYGDFKSTILDQFGWSTLRNMISVVSSHTGDLNNIKRMLLQPVMFVSEAVRFHLVCDLLTASYDSYCTLNPSTWKWINNWTTMSEAIINLKLHGHVKNFSVEKIEEAKHVLATIKADCSISELLGPSINLVEGVDNEGGDNEEGAGRGVGGGLGGRGAHGAAPINPRGRGHRAHANLGARKPTRMSQRGHGHDSTIFYMKIDLKLLNLLVHSSAKERMTRDNVAEITRLLLSGELDARNKMSHRCLASELQQFPMLRRYMDEVICNFLGDGLQQAMITHITEIEDGLDDKALEKRSRAIFARTGAHGVASNSLQGRHGANGERPVSSGEKNTSSWGISSVFGGGEDQAPTIPKEKSSIDESANSNVPAQPLYGHDQSFSIIQLREMDHSNTPHLGFVGGSKVVELAQQQVKTARMSSTMIKSMDGVDEKASEKRWITIFARWITTGAHGVASVSIQGRHGADGERPGSSGEKNTSSCGISSIFGGGEDRAAPVPKENISMNKYSNFPALPLNDLDQSFSIIQLREPPVILKLTEKQSKRAT